MQSGTRDLLPGESLWPRYSRLQVRIGEPVKGQGEEWQAALQLHEIVRRRILAQMEEHDTIAEVDGGS